MRITEVEPILLRGEQEYRATAGSDEATDNGDWQLLVRVATDAGLTGWADVETLAPAAVAIIAGQGMSVMGFRTLGEMLIGENPLEVERIWDKLYVSAARITGAAASPCSVSPPSTTACGRSARRRPAFPWRDCSAHGGVTGFLLTPPRCSAKRPRRWLRRRAATWRTASAR
jgi:hypothetical protein